MTAGGTECRGALLAVDGLGVAITAGACRFDAVVDVSLTVARGETLGLVGESGSGKSLTMLAVLGLLPAAARMVAGRIELDGIDLASLDAPARRAMLGARIAMVFQDPMTSLNPVMSVGAQVREAIRATTPLPRRAVPARAVELLDQVGIGEPARRASQFPHELSGGMRQRVMIAMGLAGDPELLIADEPTTALDASTQAQIVELVRGLQRERGLAVVWVSHDLGLIARVADRVAVLYAGRIVEQAPTRELLTAPRHPYSRGLLASVPRLDRPRTDPLPAIPGRPPDLALRGTGCDFAPRCASRTAVCTDRVPRPEATPTGSVACFAAALT